MNTNYDTLILERSASLKQRRFLENDKCESF